MTFFKKFNFLDIRVFAHERVVRATRESFERRAGRRTSRSRSYAVRPRGDRAGVDGLVWIDERSRSCPSSVSGSRSFAALVGSTSGAGEPAEAEASAREAISVVVFGGFVVARVEVARRAASVALK